MTQPRNGAGKQGMLIESLGQYFDAMEDPRCSGKVQPGGVAHPGAAEAVFSRQRRDYGRTADRFGPDQTSSGTSSGRVLPTLFLFATIRAPAGRVVRSWRHFSRTWKHSRDPGIGQVRDRQGKAISGFRKDDTSEFCDLRR